MEPEGWDALFGVWADKNIAVGACGPRIIGVDPSTLEVVRMIEFADDYFIGLSAAVGFDSVWIEDGRPARLPVDAFR